MNGLREMSPWVIVMAIGFVGLGLWGIGEGNKLVRQRFLESWNGIKEKSKIGGPTQGEGKINKER